MDSLRTISDDENLIENPPRFESVSNRRRTSILRTPISNQGQTHAKNNARWNTNATEPPCDNATNTQNNYSNWNAANALDNFARVRESRQAALQKYKKTSPPSDDDEINSDCPILTSFASTGGWDAIHSCTNFSQRGFHSVWDIMAPEINRSWNVGRGKRHHRHLRTWCLWWWLQLIMEGNGTGWVGCLIWVGHHSGD